MNERVGRASQARQFFRPDVQRDVDDEIAYHLEMRQRELIDRGVLPGEAREAVAQRFGNVAAIARECRVIDEAWYREQRRASMWMDLKQDIAYAFRMLAKAPAFTAVAVVTLALGIGATAAIASLANWALLRPVPGVHAPGDVRVIWSGQRRAPTSFTPSFVSFPNQADMTSRLQTVTVAGWQRASFNIGKGTAPARPVIGAFASSAYFDVLGLAMRAGRPISAKDDSPGAPVLVVSERFASATFGSAAAAIGEVLQANGIACTIVGVVGRGFTGTERMNTLDVWAPGALYPVLNHQPTLSVTDRRGTGFYEFVARLHPGATWAEADAELQSMAAWLASTYPKENARFAKAGFHIFSEIGAPPLQRPLLVSMAMQMLGASALVLLIACANVASLLMMRGVGRSGEVAVRKALGAARFRLVRQHLTEGALLWLLGGAFGLLIVWLAMRSANGVALLGQRGGTASGVPLDWRVVAFTSALSLLVGLVFSLVPAFRSVRVEASQMLREGSVSQTPRGLRVGTSLTVVQLALSLTLLVGALLQTATVRHLSSIDLGFEPEGVYTFMVRPGSIGYSPAQGTVYRDEFARQLSLTPGVERVAVSTRAPFVGSSMTTRVRVEGGTDLVEPHATELLSPGYFETLGIPLLGGRLFTEEDLGVGGAQGHPVVVVSEGLARRLFGSVSPVGRTIQYATMGREGKRFEIIGVVGDIRFGSLLEEPKPMVYEPAALNIPVRPDATFLVRAKRGTDVAGAVRTIAGSLNASLPPVLPMSMGDGIARSRAEFDVLARLMMALAAVAAILAAVGLYGVIAFGVAARRREFGIRLALGAAPARVVWLVLRRTTIMTVCALVLGSAGAIALARFLSNRLVGVTPFDPSIWGTAVLMFLALAAVASWIPARRAVSVDVTKSLRAL